MGLLIGSAPRHFLNDPFIHLDNIHVWVAFSHTFKAGSVMKRSAWTELDRFWDSNGVCTNGEISLSWKDTHGRAVTEQVALQHLLPAPPKSAGDLVVILTGPHQGVRGKVVTY